MSAMTGREYREKGKERAKKLRDKMKAAGYEQKTHYFSNAFLSEIDRLSATMTKTKAVEHVFQGYLNNVTRTSFEQESIKQDTAKPETMELFYMIPEHHQCNGVLEVIASASRWLPHDQLRESVAYAVMEMDVPSTGAFIGLIEDVIVGVLGPIPSDLPETTAVIEPEQVDDKPEPTVIPLSPKMENPSELRFEDEPDPETPVNEDPVEPKPLIQPEESPNNQSDLFQVDDEAVITEAAFSASPESMATNELDQIIDGLGLSGIDKKNPSLEERDLIIFEIEKKYPGRKHAKKRVDILNDGGLLFNGQEWTTKHFGKQREYALKRAKRSEVQQYEKLL